MSHFARTEISFAQNVEWQPSAIRRSRVLWNLEFRECLFICVFAHVSCASRGAAPPDKCNFFFSLFANINSARLMWASMWHANFISFRLVCSQIEFSVISSCSAKCTHWPTWNWHGNCQNSTTSCRIIRKYSQLNARGNREHPTHKKNGFSLPFKANLVGLRNTIFIRHSRGQIDRDESNDNWRFRLAEIVLHTDTD